MIEIHSDTPRMRRTRLANYMREQVWIDLMDAIDDAFYPEIDENVLRFRDIWTVDNIHPKVLEQKAGQSLIYYTDNYYKKPNTQFVDADGNNMRGDIWLDKLLRIQLMNKLGFDYFDPSAFDSPFEEAMISQGPIFWGEAGTPSLSKFLGFVLNAQAEIKSLWSKSDPDSDSYGTMVYEEEIPEGEKKIFEGGSWFRTSHVDILIDGGVSGAIDVAKLVTFFNKLSNINLVLNKAYINYSGKLQELNLSVVARTRIIEKRDLHRTIPERFYGITGRTRIVHADGI